jgi:hypothetical protein
MLFLFFGTKSIEENQGLHIILAKTICAKKHKQQRKETEEYCAVLSMADTEVDISRTKHKHKQEISKGLLSAINFSLCLFIVFGWFFPFLVNSLALHFIVFTLLRWWIWLL